jgi:hypothetical protein
MASDGAPQPRCPDTGLAVPECSCTGCLEAMLREHRPTLLAEQIRVTRMRDSDREEPGETPRREAA